MRDPHEAVPQRRFNPDRGVRAVARAYCKARHRHLGIAYGLNPEGGSRRFRSGGFYVLDEPETGLSQLGQIALLAEVVKLANAGSQFIIASSASWKTPPASFETVQANTTEGRAAKREGTRRRAWHRVPTFDFHG